MLTTDWMKVATAGRTLDGREIKPEWLEKMAASYSPQVYTASVNSEHVFYPGLGHVTELRAGQDAQGRLAVRQDRAHGGIARTVSKPQAVVFQRGDSQRLSGQG